ncbi:MAG: hypothetical protein HZB46_11415 [Solirubrobacterales bacterium]|nr:hypothetical protein [Solirubrobacterales bacterium]
MTTRASDPRLPRLFSEQRGFTMVSVMLGMFVIGLLAVGSWQAAVGDIPIARGDQDRKRAYQAAEAGLEWYAYQLARDPNYWTSCTSVPDVAAGVPAPVNQAWLTGADTRTRWRALPNSNARYAIELLPASGRTSCSTADPQGSMLQNGTLRIRSTGVANGDRRQIVSTFRRRTFIDFIYFTDRETLAPVAYSAYPAYVSAGYTSTWAQTNCQGQRAVRNSV